MDPEATTAAMLDEWSLLPSELAHCVIKPFISRNGQYVRNAAFIYSESLETNADPERIEANEFLCDSEITALSKTHFYLDINDCYVRFKHDDPTYVEMLLDEGDFITERIFIYEKIVFTWKTLHGGMISICVNIYDIDTDLVAEDPAMINFEVDGLTMEVLNPAFGYTLYKKEVTPLSLVIMLLCWADSVPPEHEDPVRDLVLFRIMKEMDFSRLRAICI